MYVENKKLSFGALNLFDQDWFDWQTPDEVNMSFTKHDYRQ